MGMMAVMFNTAPVALIGTDPSPDTWIVIDVLALRVFPSHWLSAVPERLEGLFGLVSHIRNGVTGVYVYPAI